MSNKFSKSARVLLGIKAGEDDVPTRLAQALEDKGFMDATCDFNSVVGEATADQLASWVVDVEGDDDGFVEGADYYELCDAGEQVLREYIEERRSIFEPEIGKLQTGEAVMAVKAEGEVVGPVQSTQLATEPGKPKPGPGQKIDPKTGKPFAEVLQTAMDDKLKNAPKA